jgi:4-hydroxyproline epimerase
MTDAVHVIDSHTEGEPTRTVISGGPDLGGGSLAERVERFRAEFDWFRSGVVNEPRGCDAMVGALLVPPVDPASAAGVIFFNNVGYLNMCGHGTIGVVATLAHQGRIGPGRHTVETPVGSVVANLHADGSVAIDNVPSYRHAAGVAVEVPGMGIVRGDVAWGGNWFFLVSEHGERIKADNIERLTEAAWAIRRALGVAGIAGRDGAEIDHVELFGPPSRPGPDSRNFVLCPGKAYDRSPCGTGTSAKAACLFADGRLRVGQVWRQESIIGSEFTATVREENGKVIPTIRGRAFVTGEGRLLFDAADPFRAGIRL